MLSFSKLSAMSNNNPNARFDEAQQDLDRALGSQ